MITGTKFDLNEANAVLSAEIAAIQIERNKLRAELDSLKQSILDLSHPNCQVLLKERDQLRADNSQLKIELSQAKAQLKAVDTSLTRLSDVLIVPPNK